MLRQLLRKTLGSASILVVVAGLSAPATAQTGGDTEVTVGSDDTVFSQNKQNEPAVAIDPAHPTVVAAGSNDNIDMEACNAGPPTDCPFTLDVGGSGVYFSFNSGDSWIQPTYTGLTARDCLGNPDPTVTTDVCVAHPGPIGTLPHYDEAGLVSDGDPAVAFGPIPDDNGEFDWDNGSRLYYANLTSNVSVSETITFKGFEAIGVSRIDGDPALTPTIVADEDNWLDPVIVSKQSSATFADKEQLWVDNAESSPFFGNAYVCFAKFQGAGAAPMTLATSTDGGDTWSSDQVSPGHNVAPRKWGQSGCTIRTDSEGVVYVFYEQFQNPERFLPPNGSHFMVKSFNGGGSWTRPQLIQTITDPCYALQFDGSTNRCVQDGIAGARNDLAASPNISIANGAPTGADATDEIVLNWAGFNGGSAEHVFVRTSTNGGDSWSAKVAVERAGDRGMYTAPAFSPDGDDIYLVYNAFTTPYRDDTTSARGLVGVVLHADVGANGMPGAWTELHRGVVGDPRASAQNNIVMEFLGDYVYAAATNEYAVAVWNDVRDGDVCGPVQSWRADMQADPSTFPDGRPAIQQQCLATFGNTDIFSWSGLDPTA
jgi:hypothetical protein